MDYSNSSSAVVKDVSVVTSLLPSPRALWLTQTLNVSAYHRLYVAGGPEGAGYVAYVDLLNNNKVFYLQQVGKSCLLDVCMHA
jgi:hypothetical protein